MNKAFWAIAFFSSFAQAQQLTVRVPGTAQIYLAGAGDGAARGQDRTPANLPVLLDLPISGGQALQITATGEINLDVRQASRFTLATPNGTEEPWPTPCPGVCTSTICSGAACLGEIWARRGSLVGMFLGGPNVGANRVANYLSSAISMPVQDPLPGLPFLIGTGRTPEGTIRTIIVPKGATRLWLGVLDDPVSDNSGSFTASVAVVSSPPAPGSTNPLKVLGNGQVLLAAAPAGVSIDYDGHKTDFAPLNSPAVVDLIRLGARALRIGAVGAVDLSSTLTAVPPGGRPGTNFVALRTLRTGFSNISAPLGSLLGVFTADEADPTLGNAFTSDFTTPASRNAVTLRPLLQQFFYIGSGRTDTGEAKRFVIPEGATRLFLGVNDGPASDNYGSFFVAVSPELEQGPSFQLSGIINGGGFGAGPLAAGSIASIFGSNLSAVAQSATSVPLPKVIAGTRVWFNSLEAPLFAVSPTQINAQIPPELISEQAVQVVVSAGGPPGTPSILTLAPFRPGIFTYGQNAPVIVKFPPGQLVSSAEPVKPGDVLVIYATGLGAVTPFVAGGAPAPTDTLSLTNTPLNVVIGGVNVQPQFSGLAPGFIGVYQINVQVPSGIPQGSTVLSIKGLGAESNKVEIQIQN